jgi:hypothetical protein
MMTQKPQHKDNPQGIPREALRQLAERDQPQPIPPTMDDARRRHLDDLRSRAADWAAQLRLMRGAYLGRRQELNSERARVRRLLVAIRRELGEQ